MIPKTFHYCWFGPKALPDRLARWMESWSRYSPSFEVMKWDEESFDVDRFPFARLAYSKRRWAWVADYARAWILRHHGGIYLDTDVELKGDFRQFLHHAAFSGFEGPGLPFTAVWGAVSGHPWPTQVLEAYDRDPGKALESTNTTLVSNILVQSFGIDRNRDSYQEGLAGVVIYPSTTFCLDLPVTYACHHFDGSWVTSEQRTYKTSLHSQYYARMAEAASAASEADGLLRYSGRDIVSELFRRIRKRVAWRTITHAEDR